MLVAVMGVRRDHAAAGWPESPVAIALAAMPGSDIFL